MSHDLYFPEHDSDSFTSRRPGSSSPSPDADVDPFFVFDFTPSTDPVTAANAGAATGTSNGCAAVPNPFLTGW